MPVKEWVYNEIKSNEKSLIKRLLISRGITSEKEMEDFLNPLGITPGNPYVFTDMEKCVTRLSQAIDNNEKIVIYGDFDADGVTSTSLLYRTFTYLGGNVSYYIPHRETQGHGFETNALIEIMTQHKPKLIISCDCGISNVESVKFIKSFKVDVIITDHHDAPDELPEALAIINPKAPDALDENLTTSEIKSLTSLAGVGVAFKVATALLQHYEKTEYISSILPYAAVGTVADVVPLVGENRYIVTKGLDLISQGKHYGLKRLLENSGYKIEEGLTAETIGFGVAPRINASGRLDTVADAMKVLISDNPQEIEMAINNLEEFNKVRQTLCDQTFAEADEMVQHEGNKNPAIILFNPSWHAGVVGIVASRLVEKYYKPTLLMTYSEETKLIKCSARSIEGVHLFEVLNSVGEIFEIYGGHAMAAGLSFYPEKIPFKSVKNRILQAIKEHTQGKELKPFLKVDFEVEPDDISINLVEELAKLEPFGAENPSPVFTINDLKIKEKKLMGENKNHLRLTVQKGNSEFTAVWWQRGDISLVAGDSLDMAFHPRINEFRGNISVQLIIDDIHSEYLKETEEEKSTKLKIYDHRKKLDILPQVNDYVKNSKQDIRIFAESRQIIENLRPYQDISSRIFNRENIEPCSAVMFFDYPADKETFETIIREASPSSIHLMNYEIKYFDEKEFLKIFAGMLKFASNNNGGKVSLIRCASHLGKSVELVAKLIDLFEQCGFIEVKDKSTSNYTIKFLSIDNLGEILHRTEYSGILNMVEDCEFFQKSLLEDDLIEIDNLCNII